MYSRKVGGNVAKANSQNLRISVKNAKPVCKAVRGLSLKKAKEFLSDILREKKSINGKYYTNSVREVLTILKSAEKNAEFKNLDLDNIYIAHIAALDGTHMHRRRRKRDFGTKIKSAHLEVILKERTRGVKKEEKTSEKEKKEEKEPVKKSEEEKETKSEEIDKEEKPAEKKEDLKEKKGKEEKSEEAKKPDKKESKPGKNKKEPKAEKSVKSAEKTKNKK